MHLDSAVTDAEMHIAQYAIFCRDSRGRSHSVVAMSICENVTPLVFLSLSNAVGDTLMMHAKQAEVFVCTIYRSLCITKYFRKFEHTLKHLEEVLIKLHQNIILFLDDFMPDIRRSHALGDIILWTNIESYIESCRIII